MAEEKTKNELELFKAEILRSNKYLEQKFQKLQKQDEENRKRIVTDEYYRVRKYLLRELAKLSLADFFRFMFKVK